MKYLVVVEAETGDNILTAKTFQYSLLMSPKAIISAKDCRKNYCTKISSR